MNDVTKVLENLGYFIKQIENNFRVSVLWWKHEWRHFNQKNTRKHSATPRVFTRHFSGWNDVIHVSITVQRYPSNFLFVKKRWNCLNVSTQDQIQGHAFSPSKEEKQHSNGTSYVTSMIAVEPLSLSYWVHGRVRLWVATDDILTLLYCSTH